MALHILTGAGVSAPSGVPTFRDEDTGLWTKHNYERLCIFKTYNESHAIREEARVFYNSLRVALKDVEPNKAHYGIHDIVREHNGVLWTQNADDLHDRVNDNVPEDERVPLHHLHGHILDMQCQSCNHLWRIGYQDFSHDGVCPHCSSSMVKPGVVFFGENAPKYKEFFNSASHVTSRDKFVCIGTSLEVIPIPMLLATLPSPPKTLIVSMDEQKYVFDFIHHIHGDIIEKMDDVRRWIEEN